MTNDTNPRTATVATVDRRTALLVEGASDALAVEASARRVGRDLEDDGVAVLALGGAGGLESSIKRLGRDGLGLRLLGLCDADHERRWAGWLEAAGLGRGLDRAAMEALGFFVCDPDLELELVRAVGLGRVLEIVAEEGEAGAFRTLARQPAWQGRPEEQVLRRFFGSRSGRKAKYAPLLVAALPDGSAPRPLVELLARVSAAAE